MNYFVKFAVAHAECEFEFDLIDVFTPSLSVPNTYLYDATTLEDAFTQAAQQVKKMARTLKQYIISEDAESRKLEPVTFEPNIWKNTIKTLVFINNIVTDGITEDVAKDVYAKYAAEYGEEAINDLMTNYITNLDDKKYACMWSMNGYAGAIEIIPHEHENIIAIFETFAHLY